MIDRLEATLKRYNEIGKELANPEIISDIISGLASSSPISLYLFNVASSLSIIDYPSFP